MDVDSRANRRRRWWLRAQAALQSRAWLETPSPVEPAPTEPPAADATPSREPTWYERWTVAMPVPAGVTLELVQSTTGTQLRVPFTAPCLLVGQGADCGVRLNDPRLAARELALVWIGGELHVIHLGDSDHRTGGVAQPWPRGRKLRCGSWQIALRGWEPDDPSEGGGRLRGAHDLRIELHWSGTERLPTPVDPGLNLYGSARDSEIWLRGSQVAPVQGGLVRTTTGVWVIDFAGEGRTRVNGRAVEFAPLEPGDVLGCGTEAAWLMVSWPTETGRARLPQTAPTMWPAAEMTRTALPEAQNAPNG